MPAPDSQLRKVRLRRDIWRISATHWQKKLSLEPALETIFLHKEQLILSFALGLI
jgi:hypothetical protein